MWPYILASTVLFESADEALNGLLSAGVEFADPPPRRSVALSGLDDMTLIANYVQSNGRQSTVAQRLGMPRHQAEAMLCSLGLPNLIRGRHASHGPLKAAEAFFLEGRSASDSADIGGLTTSEMEQLIRKSGSNLTSALQAIAVQNSQRKIGAKRSKGLMPRDLNFGPEDLPLDASCQRAVSRRAATHARETEPQKSVQNAPSGGKRSSYLPIRTGSLLRNAATAGATGAK